MDENVCVCTCVGSLLSARLLLSLLFFVYTVIKHYSSLLRRAALTAKLRARAFKHAARTSTTCTNVRYRARVADTTTPDDVRSYASVPPRPPLRTVGV